MTFLWPRAPTSGPRMRLYCETIPSLLKGWPSKYQVGRPRMPVAPPSIRRKDEVTRGLNSGSRYFSNSSGGSMMCMSQSTNRQPSFIPRLLQSLAQRCPCWLPSASGPVIVIPGRRAAASPESIFQRPVFMDSGPRPSADPVLTRWAENHDGADRLAGFERGKAVIDLGEPDRSEEHTSELQSR